MALRDRLAIAVVSVACALPSLPARAQPHEVVRGPALNWVRLSGAESCIAAVELASRVEQRLGRGVFVRMPDAIIVVEGQIGALPTGGFTAKLRVVDVRGQVYGEREISLADADCRRLDELVALVIAVTIRGQGSSSAIPMPPDVTAALDALFENEPAQLDPAELPPSVPAATPIEPRRRPAPQPRAAVAAEPVREEPRAFELGMGAGVFVMTGVQPDGTLGPALHVRVGARDVGSVVASAGLGLAEQIGVPDPDAAEQGELRLQPMQAAVAVCAPALRLLGSLALCGHVSVGLLHARAQSFADNRAASELWVEAGPEASVRAVLVAPVYVRFGVRVPVRLSRPAFEYTRTDATPEEIFRVAPVGIAGELGLGVDIF